jgi:HK97 family phage prohead protease
MKVTRDSVQIETKALPILSKEIGEDRVVKSLFAVMGHVDSVQDRILNGAFAKTLAERMDRVKVLWQHDAAAPPVGVALGLYEIGAAEMPDAVRARWPDATGALLGEVKYLDTPRGNEILQGIREGAISENSIGFDPIPGKVLFDADGVRNIAEVRLWDISPVNWGAQEAAVNVKRLLVASKDHIDPKLYEMLTRLNGLAEQAIEPDLLKAGRVLSSRNLDRLKAALETLSEILLAAEPPESEEEYNARKALTDEVLARLASY